MEDNMIIEMLFERTESALSELDVKYGRLCRSLSNNILNNMSDSEECVNDAYLGVWNNIPPERPDSLKAYLCRIVRNISLKKYRYNTALKRNSQMDLVLEELEGCLASDKGNNPEQVFEQKELTKAIEEFMDTLKETDRILFMRRFYFSDSYADIAEYLGITEKNASVKLTRTREKLRKYLMEKGFIF